MSVRRKLSVPMLARQWGVADQKVRDLIRCGQLRAIDLAGVNSRRPRYAIDLADIEAFERSRQVVPDTGTTTRRVRRRAAVEVKDYFPHL